MDGKHTVHSAHPMLNTTQREDSDFQEGEGKFPITSDPHGKYCYGSQICPYSAVPSSPTHEQMHEAQNPEQPHDPSASPGALQEMPVASSWCHPCRCQYRWLLLGGGLGNSLPLQSPAFCMWETVIPVCRTHRAPTKPKWE